jgi:hypothetical protein
MIGGVFSFGAAAAGSSTDWSTAVPLIAALLGAALAYGWNVALKRRDEKRELQALVRLLDDELATLQGALEALIAAAASSDEPGQVIGAARVVAEARSGAVWTDKKLALARHLPFDEWDLLRDVYATIDVSWLGARREVDDLTENELVAEIEGIFNATGVAPGLLKVIGRARDVCLRPLGGRPPAKVSLGSADHDSE